MAAIVEDQFPIGMRVLAVDDDPVCLKILENLLRKCQYHVTTTNQAITALRMLRENKSKYDLVISDVHMPDMDVFKLLELIGLEIDLPVIMLSSHSDKDLVSKGVTHGAVDYLLKPVRIEELKNVWQHVIRKKKLFPKDPTRSLNEGNEEENGTQKKPPVVWYVDMHRKFIQAVDQLGLEKAVREKILDLMNVQGLTRENVASHLQKYKLYMKRVSSPLHGQNSNMSGVFGARDHCFSRPDGYGDSRSSDNPGRYSSSPPGGMASSSLFQPPQSMSQSNHSFGKMQAGPLPGAQLPNLFQGVPTSLDSNQLHRKPAVNYGDFNCNNNVTGFSNGNSFQDSNMGVSGLGNNASTMPSNAMMFQLKQQNVQSGGEFPTQAPLNIPLLSQNSFGADSGGPSSLLDPNASNKSRNGRGVAKFPSFRTNSLPVRARMDVEDNRLWYNYNVLSNWLWCVVLVCGAYELYRALI